MTQKHTSKDTSINSTKLPAIFGKLRPEDVTGAAVIDFGAGRYTDHIAARVDALGAAEYYPYDPYNQPEPVNDLAALAMADVITCSNVLNVVDSDEAIYTAVEWMTAHLLPGGRIFCTVYTGDGTCHGKETQKGQSWQRNAPLADYVRFFRALDLQTKITRGMIIATLPEVI